MAGTNGPVLVLDLETQNTFAEVGGKQNLHRLRISVVCVYHYETETYRSYTENDISKLEEALRSAGLIVGFNIRSFDFGILKNYLFTPPEQFPILDLLEEIEKVRGHRVSLQSLAEATFKDHKTGDGLDAVRLFREGRMQELTDYCINDVRLTKDIYEYGNKFGKVYFRSFKDFKVYEIPVTWNSIKPKEKSSTAFFPASLF